MSHGVLTPFEAEHLVQQLAQLSLEDVGSEKWMKQHEVIEKLNIQAHHSALTKHDEFVVEAIVSAEKVATLVHDLLITEVWKDKVFPLLKDDMGELSIIKTYIVLYHEATLCNLFEVLLYHQHACAAAEDTLCDLIDYCYRKLILLNSRYFDSVREDAETKESKASAAVSERERIQQQSQQIAFSTAVCAVSMLRFITDHVAELPVAVAARLMDKHDVLLSLVPLVESPPWTRRRGAVFEKFVDQKWNPTPPEDRLKLTKTEAQVWLTIYGLLMDVGCRKRYSFSSHRKNNIMKLKKYFNEVLIDQLPLLKQLQRYVEELALVNPPEASDASSSIFLIETVSEIREKLLEECDFAALAAKQKATHFANDEASRRQDMKRLAATYNLDDLDELLDDPYCSNPGCGKKALNRCSRCHNDWYCSRECQVKNWKAHKAICDLITTDAAAKREKSQMLGTNQSSPLIKEIS